MTRIYLDQPLTTGAELTLTEAAHRHLVQVLRLREGAALVVFDGRGVEAAAHLLMADKRSSRIRIDAISRPPRESPLQVALLQGISKGDRMDYTLQKAVELGVSAIQPLSTQRSMVKLDAERWERKREHWQGVVISACEQSGRTVLPPLLPVATLQQALAALPADTVTLALLPDRGQPLRHLPRPSQGIALLVGPEGGFDPVEIETCRAAGCTSVQLGPRILRTETAGVATLAAMQALWGDWGPGDS